jgi:hypothetical protein
MPLKVVTAEGRDSGRTIRADDGAPVRVATAADQSRFEERFLEGLRLGAPRDTPFSVAGTMRVTFDGTTCVDERPTTVAPGNYILEVESTAQAPVLFAQVRLKGDASWTELLADSAKDPSHTEPPSYADVPWTTVLEVPGSSRAVLEFEPATYGLACLYLGDQPRVVPAATGFTVAVP